MRERINEFRLSLQQTLYQLDNLLVPDSKAHVVAPVGQGNDNGNKIASKAANQGQDKGKERNEGPNERQGTWIGDSPEEI